MAEKKFVVPEVLAILPVRDTVLFPGAVLPLTVGRESSLALVNSLQGDEKLLGVVAQLDPRVEDPAAADLHKVGVEVAPWTVDDERGWEAMTAMNVDAIISDDPDLLIAFLKKKGLR